jgi:hypothetical protein
MGDMNLRSDDISSWGITLDDFKPEYTSIKVWNLIQFYTLVGRRTMMIKENLEPLETKYALHSPQENKYYLKDFRRYNIDDLILRPGKALDLDKTEVCIQNFRRYFTDGNLYLLFDAKQMDDTKAMLSRLWKAQFTEEGSLSYKIFIELFSESISYEDYRDFGKSLTGFRTVSNQYDTRIKELWAKVKINKK